MKKAKKILGSVLLGAFGFALSLCIAPIVVITVVGYMTKVSFEIGYSDEFNEKINDVKQDLNDKLKYYES